MSRAKVGVVRHRRHKKIIAKNKGYYGTRSKLFRRANEAFLRAGEHAFRGRKLRKRDMKTLWIIRLHAALGQRSIRYSQFIRDLGTAHIELDRKILSDIAVRFPETFDKIIEKTKKS